MAVTQYIHELAGQITKTSPTAYPGIIATLYLEYLWNYEPGSWVSTFAYAARTLAIIVSIPTLIVGLLDIASYGIARTLGVVDVVKASTSDKSTVHLRQPPSILIELVEDLEESGGASDSLSSSTASLGSNGTQSQLRSRVRSPSDSSLLQTVHERPPEFFATGDDSLKLSGVDVISPAVTRPPSPVITRKSLSSDLNVKPSPMSMTTSLGPTDDLRRRQNRAI